MGLTRRFYWFLTAGLLWLPFIALKGELLWGLFLYDGLLVSLALVDWLTLPQRDRIGVVRTVARVVFLNRPITVELSLENRSPTPLRLTVEDEPPRLLGETEARAEVVLPGRTKRLVRYDARSLIRGESSFERLAIRYRRSFGLAWRQFRQRSTQPLSVLPDLTDLVHAVPGKETLREGERATGLPGVGSEFEQMRPYVPGDDPRKVDWKASARARHMIVRQYRADRNREVVFLLETGRSMAIPWGVENRFDAALSAVLTVARKALDGGDKVRVFGIGDDLTPFPMARLRRDFHLLVRRINHLEPSDVEPHRLTLYAQVAQSLPQRAMIILFTDLALVPQDALWLSTLRILRTRHRVILVHMADPNLRKDRKILPNSPEAAAAFSVAGYFLETERRAVHVLRSEGIRVLVAHPKRLASDLLRQYETARQTGWI